MKRTTPLILILLLALLLRLTGIGFGLPNHQHAYPYNPDEWTPFQSYRAMNPRALDFNPHYFFNPTFHYYLCGAAIFAARLMGLVNISGNDRFYFEHPEHVARMILIGRLLSTLFGVLTIWLVYLLARRLRLDRPMSLLAALFLALHTSHAIHAHFFTVNTAVTFWSVLCLLGIERWIRRGGVSSLVWVGVTAGLAASTKYSGVLLWPLGVLAGWLRFQALRATPAFSSGAGRKAISETAIAGAIAVVVFLLGTPYIVLAFPEFLHGFEKIGDFVELDPGPKKSFLNLVWHVVNVHLFASTPGLVVASLAGALMAVKRRLPLDILVVVWAAVFVALSVLVGSLSSDSRFLPLFPVVVVLAAMALGRLQNLHREAGLVAILASLVLLAFNSACVLARFVGPMPQETSSAWARASVPDSATVNLSGSAVYYAPDFPLRESLQKDNSGNYARETAWRFVPGLRYADARPAAPDIVFLTVNLPAKPKGMEWLTDPEYHVVGEFPGKVRYFGRRVRVPLDLYDVDIWVLKKNGAEPGG